ncbi:MAG: carboxypeptidase-like regulatory domain-containing protein [Bacteroidetes bacterium]|nr:carboxypeptidase-like regulatory domain-containing protein [Bacteroidota bacterium]
MKRIFLTLLLAFYTLLSYSQNYQVKGTVLDTAGIPLTGTLIKLKNGNDSVQTAVDLDGNFKLNNVKWPSFTLSAAFIGFKTFIKNYTISTGNVPEIPLIRLKPSSNTLDEVTITAVTAIKISEDTVTFNASSFPVRQGDAVDEMLRKLPGVKVDADGNVTTQGDPITKIRINGKDFFGTDVATAIKNLPADIIKNLQIIDDFGDHANLTGVKTGEAEKVLNLTILEEKKRGYSTRISGGLGNEDR